MSVFNIFSKIESPKTLTPIEYMICGLGNPGTQYENTRHNCGFMTVDTLAEQEHFDVKRLKFKSLTTDAVISGKRCLVMKPTTFMNNSGDALAEASEFYKIPPEKIIVICDDITQDVGKIRIRRKGSDGGQNGLKSIILSLNSDNFPRIRIGIGAKPDPDYDLAAWVLSRFTKQEGILLEKAFDNACCAVRMILSGDIDSAMASYNTKNTNNKVKY